MSTKPPHSTATPLAPVPSRDDPEASCAVPRCSVHFSSATDVWPTPQSLFDELHHEFGFTLDVCALAANAKCPAFFTPEMDGLAQEWTGVCWMNPPYGRSIGRWMEKAFTSAAAGALVVCLVPARTDTAWWHEFVTKASEVRFLRGRLRFGGAEASAPFPSALVIFRPPPRESAYRAWRLKP